MLPSAKHRTTELNTSSVADIAFLLLSFFLMTTVISNEKGLSLILPEWREAEPEHYVHERNIFKIQINSQNELLVEGERTSTFSGLRKDVRKFVLNNNADPDLSENPGVAIVSIKTDRGTSHSAFMNVLDEVQAAYFEIYSQRAGMKPAGYRALDASNARDRAIMAKARQGIPMNISIANPVGLPSR
jgi:biopolymer transport protein ExbD